MRDFTIDVNLNFAFVVARMRIRQIIPFTGIKRSFVIVNVQESATSTVRPDFDAVSGVHPVAESDMSSTATHTRAKDDCVCAWEPVEINPGSLCDFIFNVKNLMVSNFHKIAGCAELDGLSEFSVNPLGTALKFAFKAVFRKVLSLIACPFVKWHVQHKPLE